MRVAARCLSASPLVVLPCSPPSLCLRQVLSFVTKSAGLLDLYFTVRMGLELYAISAGQEAATRPRSGRVARRLLPVRRAARWRGVRAKRAEHTFL